MSKTLCLIITIVCLLLKCDVMYAGTDNKVKRIIDESVSDIIRTVIIQNEPDSFLSLGGEPLYSARLLERFYTKRKFKPAWTSQDKLMTNVDSLIETIEEVSDEGLVPEFYHLEQIKELAEQVRSVPVIIPETAAEMDILLSDAFLMLGCHFSAGCVNPVTVKSKWYVTADDMDIDVILEESLRNGFIQEELRDLLPVQKYYRELSNALINYRKVLGKGGWQKIESEYLFEGYYGIDVKKLIRRLLLSGDLDRHEISRDDYYDDTVRTAVVKFQTRHGLAPDGVVGPETRKALNLPAGSRLRQIEINLERMRWISRNLGHRYIIVNIASFQLDVIEYNRAVMSIDVVAGKPYWNTPVFTEDLTYIVFNPSWWIPEGISKNEMIPKIRSDLSFLENNNIKIYDSWLKDANEVEPSSVDWNTIDGDTLPIVLRQEPGPLNPLGKIKFMLPNKYNIYLHDTPSKHLFDNNSRAFSHGCVRVRRPVDLAEYLLTDQKGWDREKITALIDEGVETRIDLDHPVKVHFVYLTAWVDENGVLQFREDVYGRDSSLSEALFKQPSPFVSN